MAAWWNEQMEWIAYDKCGRSGPQESWIKVKNPKAPAATRAINGKF